MITEGLSTLKIHKLTQAQYDRELAAGRIDENALYLTPDKITPIESGGTGASDANAALRNLGALSRVLSSEDFGTSLPDAGTFGRIFFKKVNN